ncbi:MAG: MazG nucleotide pyrophosphohydrolase domain-containing protein [bacterium]|nr:MazG nucleotide pyrophosphohydrolase domain-containing protein [bacterium]
MNIVKEIGLPAVLEQTAEECSELAQACLKLARKMRNDNPTPKATNELWENFYEELADVLVCVEALDESKNIDCQKVLDVQGAKAGRWEQRIMESKI